MGFQAVAAIVEAAVEVATWEETAVEEGRTRVVAVPAVLDLELEAETQDH